MKFKKNKRVVDKFINLRSFKDQMTCQKATSTVYNTSKLLHTAY